MSGGAAELRVRHHRLHFFVREALKRVRLGGGLASQMADALVGASLTGSDDVGVGWLPELITGLSTRHLNPAPELRVVASSGAVAVLDGDNGPGPVVAHRAMSEATQLANSHGVGAVAVRRSNRPGALDFFAGLATPHVMAGIALSNETPERGDEAAPAAFAPVRIGLAVPMAETAPPLRLALRLPGPDRAIDADDPGQPWGPDLALALETLVLLGGGALAAEMMDSRPEPTHRGTGHLFLAFRIRAFAPWAGFRNRMVERLDQLRRARVRLPGLDIAEVEEQRRTFGIPLDADTAAALGRLAHHLELGEVWESLVAPGR